MRASTIPESAATALALAEIESVRLLYRHWKDEREGEPAVFVFDLLDPTGRFGAIRFGCKIEDIAVRTLGLLDNPPPDARQVWIKAVPLDHLRLSLADFPAIAEAMRKPIPAGKLLVVTVTAGTYFGLTIDIEPQAETATA